MRTDEEPVVVEQTFHVPVETVWNAITDVELMRQWFFDNIPEFKAEVGFETRFNVSTGERDFLHVWTVTEAIPQTKLVYNWRYPDYPGDSFVIFELSDQGGSTKLTVRTDVREDFPDEIPEFKRESCEAGWQYFIQQNLKRFLENM